MNTLTLKRWSQNIWKLVLSTPITTNSLQFKTIQNSKELIHFALNSQHIFCVLLYLETGITAAMAERYAFTV